MTGRLLTLVSCLVAGLAWLPAQVPTRALVIYSYNDDLPWQKGFRSGLFADLALAAPENRPILYEERLDASRLGPPANPAGLADYIGKKYAATTFDMILTESGFAATFLRDHPDLFPGIRRYYINHGFTNWNPRESNGIDVREDMKSAIALIPQVLPQVSQIIIVLDKGPLGTNWLAQLQPVIAEYAGTIDFLIWNEFTVQELEGRAKTIKPNAAIFFMPVFSDRTGARLVPFEIAGRIATAASVPVFAHHETLLGSGILGGYLLSSENIGRIAAGILRGTIKDPAGIANFQAREFSTKFDWEAMQRFGLQPDKLPRESQFINQPESLWGLYHWQIIGILALLALETVLILALLGALRGRRKAMAALDAEHRLLERRVEDRTRELAEVNLELEKLATTDVLTGIANRRKFLMQGELELFRARRFKQPLSLLMIDLDHFKQINDQYGHEQGDQVLVRVSAAISALLRNIDTFARFGGEEFTVLLPDSAALEARQVAERLRQTVAGLQFSTLKGQGLACTISIGVASLDSQNPGIDIDQLLLLADTALYRAKESGRNRVV